MHQVVLITGGSSGLGKEIGRILSPNHQIVLLAPDKEKLEGAAKEIGADFLAGDVTDYTQIEQIVKSIAEKHGRIDVLINNAGIWIEGELDRSDPTRIQKAIEVNTLGTIYCTRAVIPVMKLRKFGRIINIISQAGLYGKAERSIYNASKWAITGLTKSLQPELSKYGVAVMGIYPALVNTPLFQKAGAQKDMSKALDPTNVAKLIEFILNQPPKVTFPEVGIKNLDYY